MERINHSPESPRGWAKKAWWDLHHKLFRPVGREGKINHLEDLFEDAMNQAAFKVQQAQRAKP